MRGHVSACSGLVLVLVHSEVSLAVLSSNALSAELDFVCRQQRREAFELGAMQ